MSAVPNPPNLNPAQATPSVPGVRISPAALRVEQSKGTTRLYFYLPNRFVSLVNLFCSDPRTEFQGAHGNFYTLAVVRLLQEYASDHRDNPEYSTTIRDLEELTTRLSYEEPQANFVAALERAEVLAEHYVEHREWMEGLTLAQGVADALVGAPTGFDIAWKKRVRASRAYQNLLTYLKGVEELKHGQEVFLLDKWLNAEEL